MESSLNFLVGYSFDSEYEGWTDYGKIRDRWTCWADAKKDASLRTKKKYTVTRYKLSNE